LLLAGLLEGFDTEDVSQITPSLPDSSVFAHALAFHDAEFLYAGQAEFLIGFSVKMILLLIGLFTAGENKRKLLAV